MKIEGNAKLIKFESDVQLVKYNVLKEVAKSAFKGNLQQDYKKVIKEVADEMDTISRCCIYKERAIIEERVKLAMGGDKDNPNVIEVISAACDECPVNRFLITEACRGCLAHKCKDACPFGAIYYVGKRAYIDYTKCKECGRCKAACPYNAIAEVMRPCMRACSIGALTYDSDTEKAVINNEDCVQCGACAAACPFGAIVDKSYIVNVIDLIKRKKEKDDINIYAVVAPAIASQFTFATIGQVVRAIKTLGFREVLEAALGADIVAEHETNEFAHALQEGKNIMTSSCCPAFVKYIQKKYPELADDVSTSVSPMIAVARLVKQMDEKAKVIFIGPCTAKKAEMNLEDLKGSVDYVLTFEELLALLDASGIQVDKCEEDPLDNASFYGRIFARSGGLTEAVAHVVESNNLDVDFKPIVCNGLKECDMALKLAKINRAKGNFIEGMACEGGCISGPGTIRHGVRAKNEVDKYAKISTEKGVKESLRVFDVDKLNLERDYSKILKK
ncbi:iron hydrogenase 1 [Clostridium acetireducens DSM 10703]|jgi:[FeFe] hydrogenase (group B1/B3)|uniref:Iron hydrogenase 1 n=1 Tax=Clostridium acetireducens DSM 10703 TaxID=1121290 RepID=A0A1E8F228_9CLOT|nr:4Fe-4S dicluster domain-containing protein [Clostridium acetireducens]OFI07254.1 iron hydrogenase 1 [Clostridium acetireducens DSM 10703]